MEIVIVRHASHRSGGLTARGKHQVSRLARALDNRGVRPTLILVSERPQAQQTAEILSERLAGPEPATTVHSGPLDPVPGNPGSFDDIVHAARSYAVDIPKAGTTMLVGHEARLSNLLTQLTGTRSRPIPPAGAAAVQADTVSELLKGRGTVSFRYPVVDHQEAALRPKVQSKMTVASFLAGFVSAALVTVLFVNEFSAPKQVAAVLLTFALVLLVVTVYIYDELGMPEGFWLGGTSRSYFRRRLENLRETRQERRWDEHASGRAQEHEALPAVKWMDDEQEWHRAVADEHEAQAAQDGPLYIWMVQTWRLAFTPALVLALAGFGVIIFDAGHIATGIACGIGVVLALGWLVLRRPPLGTD